jgi:AcrR family transcriptional regulator
MTRGKLRREDRTLAALGALTRGGVAEVWVEVLAKELDATCGSFYWHFADRRALLVAALEEWERQHHRAGVVPGDRAPAGGRRLHHAARLVAAAPGGA